MVLAGAAIAMVLGCGRTNHLGEGDPSRATIKDIMDAMVDPSSDAMFESMAEIADEHGVTQRAPQTDEEWNALRRHAVILLEAPNLLIMGGREVARAHERSQNPEVELQPEAIKKLIDGDRSSFVQRARGLHEAAALAVAAIDSRDKTGLFHAIERLDEACENCHLHYWYPNDGRAQDAARHRRRID